MVSHHPLGPPSGATQAHPSPSSGTAFEGQYRPHTVAISHVKPARELRRRRPQHDRAANNNKASISQTQELKHQELTSATNGDSSVRQAVRQVAAGLS